MSERHPSPHGETSTDVAVELDEALAEAAPETSTELELELQAELTGHENDWSEIDPLMRFGVRVAGTLFIGVLILAFFLVPYALFTHGWTPS
jgi:hypothetical protein